MKSTNKIAIGIVGLGRAGWGMHVPELETFQDQFQVVAGCDIASARRKRFAEKFDVPVYRRIEDLIADENVELVDIATRSADHVPHALLALKAGKHVFLEKPIALSYREATRLKPAAARSEGQLYIRHNRRFEPGFRHILEIMKSGVLGEVFEIKLRRNKYSRRDDWQTLLRHGGGQLLNWGPHIIDHALRLLQSPVSGMWSHLRKVAAAGDAEDHLHILLEGENRRIVDLEISGGAAVPEPEYIVLGKRGGLTCSGGEIQLRYRDPAHKAPPRRAKAGTPEGGFGSPDDLKWIEKTIPVAPAAGCDMKDIWRHLHEAILHGKPFPITLDEALGVMKVISRARKGTPFENRP